MELLPSLATTVPLAAVLIGGALGYVSGRLLETRKQLALQKAQAYADYLNALGTAAINPGAAANGRAVDAKTRICVYGSPGVLQALAAFERAGARAIGEAGQSAVTQLVREMRTDMGISGSQVDEGDLQTVLFGLEHR